MAGFWNGGAGSTSGLVVVEHGDEASTARPSTTDPVLWIGTVTPSNIADGDFFLDTDEDGAVSTGRWEVVVSGNPAEAVTTADGTDWLYTWVTE